MLLDRRSYPQGVLHHDDKSDCGHQLAAASNESPQNQVLQAHFEDQLRAADGAGRNVHHGLHFLLHEAH